MAEREGMLLLRTSYAYVPFPPPEMGWRDVVMHDTSRCFAVRSNQGLRSLRSLRNGSHPSLRVKGGIGMNGSGAIPGLGGH